MDSTPARLGRYELGDVIGRGAMGTVYRAYDSTLERTLAVKTYHPHLAVRDSVRLRFQREVKTTSKLSHPNIVVVYDGGMEGEQPFIAMELIEGPTLETLLMRGRLPADESMRILLAVCDAIAYAHGEGVIHRDLKPANILMARDRHPKISDFGLAKIADSSSGLTTAPVGTPTFMAPEQILGQPVGRRADVFALGVLAYLMLTGKRPFTNEGIPAAMYAIVHTTPPPATEIAPELPPALDAFFARALAKRPEERTPDVETFASELVEAMRRRKAVPVVRRAPRWPRAAIAASALLASAAPIWLLVDAPDLVPPVRPATAEADEAVRLPAPIVADEPAPAEGASRLASLAPAAVEADRGSERADAKSRPAARDMLRVPAVVGHASIEVATAPPGAEISIDGRAHGRTPHRVTGLASGPHRVVVEKVGYAPYERTVDLARTSEHRLALTLMPSSTVLSIVSDPPGAEVHVDGASRGRTPVRIGDLAAGAHDVSVEIPGHTPYHKRMSLKPGEQREIRVGVQR